MIKKIKYAKILILCGFLLPLLWHFIFTVLILPAMQRADHDVGIALVSIYGYFFAFIIMAGFEALGSSLYGWSLHKNAAQRTKANLFFCGIGIIGFISAVFLPAYVIVMEWN